MNKLITLLTLLALALPVSTLAQPDEDRDRPERPDRERLRDRIERERDRLRDGQRDGEREGGRDGHRQRHQPISVDQVEQAIETLKAMHPDTKLPGLEKIEQMAKDDPEEAAKRLSRYPRLPDLMQMREDRPAEFELHASQARLMREVFPLVRQIREARKNDDQDKIDELRPQVRERIEKMFDVRLKIKEMEIERIRQQLARAEQELEDIRADSDALIDEKVNELMTGKGPRDDGGDRHRKKPGKPDRETRE